MGERGLLVRGGSPKPPGEVPTGTIEGVGKEAVGFVVFVDVTRGVVVLVVGHTAVRVLGTGVGVYVSTQWVPLEHLEREGGREKEGGREGKGERER